MKRIILVAVALLAVAIQAAGCGSSGTPASTASTTQPASTPPKYEGTPHEVIAALKVSIVAATEQAYPNSRNNRSLDVECTGPGERDAERAGGRPPERYGCTRHWYGSDNDVSYYSAENITVTEGGNNYTVESEVPLQETR